MNEARTVSALTAEFRRALTAAGIEDALRDARLIVGHVLGLTPLDMVTGASRTVGDEDFAVASALLERRLQGQSVHRVIGHREFYTLDLEISAETLEPRPDTEILVEALLPHMKQVAAGRELRILDLGTGTGAICLSLLSEQPQALGVGVDISEDALATSLRNAARNGLAGRYQALKSNWFEKVEGLFNVIVSNPPYIRSEVIPTLDVIVRGFDPMAALDGGPDGLEPYRVIAAQAHAYLAKDGVVGVEIGFDQKADVAAIFERAGFFMVESLKDYGENDRVLLFKNRIVIA